MAFTRPRRAADRGYQDGDDGIVADGQAHDEAQLRAVAAALGNHANELAARGAAEEIPALWETAISRFADDQARARLTVAYLWYQILHDQVPAGISIAARLLTDDRTAGPIRIQVRAAIRHSWRLQPELVERSWKQAAQAPLPDWIRLADQQFTTVGDWIGAGSWQRSRAYYEEHAADLSDAATESVLDELALGGHASLIGLHRAILVLCAARGPQNGYACVTDRTKAQQTAADAIVRGAWAQLQACGTIEALVHSRTLLGSVYVVIAEMTRKPGRAMPTSLKRRLAELAAAAASNSTSTSDELGLALAALRALPPRSPAYDALIALLQPAMGKFSTADP